MPSEETDRRRNLLYIVCDALGLDTGDYSFAYVARWSDGFSELVKDTAERAVECARQILKRPEVGESFPCGSAALRRGVA